MNMLLFFILSFAPNLSNATPLKYHCQCVLSTLDTNETCGIVSLEGTMTTSDGAVITVRDWYWFGGKKPNATCYYQNEFAATEGCNAAIEYRRQQGQCY